MFVSAEDIQANRDAVPQPGEQMASEIQDEEGNVLYRAIYDLGVDDSDTTEALGGFALKPQLASEEFLDDHFKLEMTAPPEAPLEGTGATAVEAAKLGWDIIQKNRAITDLNSASSAILNPDNMNPFDYTGAREGVSSQYYWKGYNYPFKKWKAFEVWLRVCGAYNATAPEGVAAGKYIPSLYVDFPKSPWAMFGLRMDANCTIMKPWNAGGAGSVVAQCDVVCSVSVSSFVDPARPQQFKFVANANSGFRRK